MNPKSGGCKIKCKTTKTMTGGLSIRKKKPLKNQLFLEWMK